MPTSTDMTAPRWASALLRRLTPPGRVDDVLGDLDEAHERRVRRRGPRVAHVLTGLEAADMAVALLRARLRRRRALGSVSWLDFKLGFRMLVRYPGLTLVGGIAMAFAMCVGAGTFEFVTLMVHPRLPLPDGDRIVGLRLWHTRASGVEEQAIHDFVSWREELESVEDLGAFRTLDRNLITGDGRGEPVRVADISASAFRVARVLPLLGRPLVEADEHAGAPPVVVIGYDVWRTRFAADPAVIGRTVGLDRAQATVVGVMPEGFAFPVRHNLWAPLRLTALEYGRREGPAIHVFGRLAHGVTLREARTELTALGQRAAADFPDTHEHIRPQVMPYAESISRVSGEFLLGLLSLNLFVVMLLVLVCGNVALLMFARAATRESEIVVRSALGATRARIVAQLFAEALVLGGLATVLGFAVAGFGLSWGLGMVEAELMDSVESFPFWFDARLSPGTVLYGVALMMLGAAIAGVLPALRVTRGLQSRLRETSAGGGGMRFGLLWTAVIVSQVAVTVAFPVSAFFVRRDLVRIRTLDVGFPADQYLSVRLEMDRPRSSAATADSAGDEFLARYTAVREALEQRLDAEPAVAGTTFADVLPRMYHGWNRIEVDGAAAPDDPARGPRVSSASVDTEYFDVLGTPVLAGRGFHSGDREAAARAVIVNAPFVDLVLDGRNAIGRRVRYVAGESGREEGVWYEIVGVVRDIGMTSGSGRAGIYHPVTRAGAYPLHLAVHVKGDPAAFAPRLRGIATAVDPTLRLEGLMPLDQVAHAQLDMLAFWFRLIVVVSSVALLLALGAIYSVMSFTVARRTREIGIRIALGAHPRRVVATIFRRPLAQVGLGIVAGGGLTAFIAYNVLGGRLSPREAVLVAAYAAVMLGVCMLACVVPTRRALRIQPVEALRGDG